MHVRTTPDALYTCLQWHASAFQQYTLRDTAIAVMLWDTSHGARSILRDSLASAQIALASGIAVAVRNTL